VRSRRARRAELADQLHSAAIHLLRQLRKEDDASGLSAPRLSALSVVVFGGPLTLGQLARAEQVRPPTMTKLVTGLEKEGLVRRQPDPRDKRLTKIVATAKGQRILFEGRARRVKSLTDAVNQLKENEVAQLDRGIQVFRRLIETTARRSRASEAKRANNPN
jgi:DNA-binding MarR family transcriptional regulator